MDTLGHDPNEDIIDDRAIEDASKDFFGHSQFAAQAARTIQVLTTPANIAVYAPWGSGKTSLAKLIEQQFKGSECGFVYFDAFKYAEAPLRRQFIRNVANNLGVEGEEFDDGLYIDSTDNGFKVEKKTLASALRVFTLFLGAALVVCALISLLLANASQVKFWPEWVVQFRHLLQTIFAPSIIIAPVFAFFGMQLKVTKTRFAPQSDEQFERIFRKLVDNAFEKRSDWSRLVFFIDELDRCSAKEVASTLETLRTFLEVPRCVFIVAADRSVLETAVAKKSRQETPMNVQNPYYSAGS
jgi:hypothetical protein